MSDEKNQTDDTVKAEVDQRLNELHQMADEIRVKIHLAGMDAKDKWNELEPKLEHLEKEAEKVVTRTSAEVKDLAQDLKQRFRKLKEDIGA